MSSMRISARSTSTTGWFEYAREGTAKTRRLNRQAAKNAKISKVCWQFWNPTFRRSGSARLKAGFQVHTLTVRPLAEPDCG